jgi:hypothetical protein
MIPHIARSLPVLQQAIHVDTHRGFRLAKLSEGQRILLVGGLGLAFGAMADLVHYLLFV